MYRQSLYASQNNSDALRRGENRLRAHQGLPRWRGDALVVGRSLLDPFPGRAVASGLRVAALPIHPYRLDFLVVRLGGDEAGVERTDRVTERTACLRHRDGLEDALVHCGSGGKSAGADDARDRGHGKETAPGWIAWREHHGLIECRRVCGWRAKHAVSLGHLI